MEDRGGLQSEIEKGGWWKEKRVNVGECRGTISLGFIGAIYLPPSLPPSYSVSIHSSFLHLFMACTSTSLDFIAPFAAPSSS